MTPVMTTIDYRVDNRIASATFTRPEKLNSISEEMVADLNAVLDLVEQDKGVRVLVLQGSGRAFCVGLDRDLLTRGFQDDDYLMSALAETGFVRFQKAHPCRLDSRRRASSLM